MHCRLVFGAVAYGTKSLIEDNAPFCEAGKFGCKCFDILSNQDLGEGPGEPPLFWIKKEEITEGKQNCLPPALPTPPHLP